MKIMVFDVPAESGGALSVLNDFYNEFKSDNNEYIIIISLPKLEETKNIKVLRYPWIKKSWLHRLYFDYFIAPKLIRDYKVDEVLSLQNIIIPNTRIKQNVFVHNALPFSEYRFTIFEDKLLWVYQNILDKFFLNSIKKANKVIVQTEWMKKKCTDMLNIQVNKIEVLPPKININIKNKFSKFENELITFFYPASDASFKNHKIIIEACIKLNEKGIRNYNIIFTLYGNENKHIRKLFKLVKDNNLPVIFRGRVTREEVFEYYSKSILIFPSYIETVGLPLLEARLHEVPIIVSNCDYAREILNGYKNSYYFNPNESNELFYYMREILNN